MRKPSQVLGAFTLLEVMVAVPILAVALTAIFASEAGAIRVSARARFTTTATLLARCKMAEIEEETMREIRYMDKLVDELAKGRKMKKILRGSAPADR